VLKKCRPRKGKGRVKGSHPDAEEMAAEGQVNVDVDIHPAPPEEDIPEEAVRHQQRPYHPQRAAIGRATSRGNLQLVVLAVVAICDGSCNQSWQSAIGRATTYDFSYD